MNHQLQQYLSEQGVLSAEEIETSVSLFSPDTLRKNDFFITENSICNRVAFLLHGGVRAFTTDENGEENTTCFKFENRFVASYESFAFRQASKNSIQAIEDCELLVISHDKVQYLLEKIPAWQNILNTLMQQEFLEKENYLIQFKNKSADKKYEILLKESPEIAKRVSVGHIASYLGITQRTLSRVRKKMTNQSL